MKSLKMSGKSLNIAGKKINIFGEENAPAPIVYLHTFEHEGSIVWEQCQKIGTKKFILVEIDGVDWNADMSPWPIEKMFAGDIPCSGKAAQWLQVIVSQIVPEVESSLAAVQNNATAVQQSASDQNFAKPKRFIAGYSLAGLFALWAAYNTDIFDGIISGSGSFWFPGFIEYVRKTEMQHTPCSIYLSLGDRESHVKNETLNKVEENTLWLFNHYREKGYNALFEFNTGNHYMQTQRRIAKGIKWSLSASQQIGKSTNH
jgi:predicted alpha/beta superfamily hydrolase